MMNSSCLSCGQTGSTSSPSRPTMKTTIKTINQDFIDLVRAKTIALKQLNVPLSAIDHYTILLFNKLPAAHQMEMKKMKLMASQHNKDSEFHAPG